jgi:type IV pilus assembly protein PilY1
MAIAPFTGSRLKKPFFDLNNDNVFNSSDNITTVDGQVPASGIKVGSLNSVTTLAKVGDVIKSFNNCEGACIEGRTIDPTKNSGMQSWREISK